MEDDENEHRFSIRSGSAKARKKESSKFYSIQAIKIKVKPK